MRVYNISFFYCITKIDSKLAFWEWIEEEFIPGIYDTTWYNGQQFIAPEGYISNRKAFLVGMPRLKQVRVKEGKVIAINIIRNLRETRKRLYWIPIIRQTDRQTDKKIITACLLDIAEAMSSLTKNTVTSIALHSDKGYVEMVTISFTETIHNPNAALWKTKLFVSFNFKC